MNIWMDIFTIKHDRYFPLCLSLLKSIDCSDSTLIEFSTQKDLFLSVEGLLKSTIYKSGIIMTGYKKFLPWTNEKQTNKQQKQQQKTLQRLIRQFKW